MAIVQSAWGALKRQAPVSHEAGTVKAERFTYTVPTGLTLAAGDIIELAVLPAFHTVVDATLIVDEAGTATYDVGLMSSIPGDTTQSRTCGAELFSGAADASTSRMSLPGGFRIAPNVANDRSIGVKVVGASVVGAGQVIDLILYTKQ
jgi:hypothetical protein